MKNLSNPEVKRSSAIVVTIFLLFFIIIVGALNLSFNKVKNGYIDSRATVIGELATKYPELEAELISATFKVNDKEAINKGKDILSKYGYSNDLNLRFIPSVYDAAKVSYFQIGVLILVFCLIVLALNYFQYNIIYSRVRILTKASKEILEGNYEMNIYEEKEGDFAKLCFGFKNMRSIIESQMVDLKKEKEFLVNLLSDISHQLKTPLAALIVYNDILSKPGITEENRNKFLLNSKKQLTRMEWLIRSMLKLAKVDARAINFQVKENNLNETIEEVLASLKVMATGNDVELQFEGNNIKEQIWGEYDKPWLEEALINIIKNSIEHSKGGKVIVSIEETPINMKIIVKDNGEGIEEEELPNIFKRFYKGGKSDSVGIGLSLSKSIVEAQQGYIEVKSKVDEGTEFRVVLVKKI